MKPKSTFIVMLLAFMPIMSSAATKSGAGNPTNPISVAVSEQDGPIPQDGTVLSGTSTAHTDAPRGPKELFENYEAEMATIAQKFTATLTAITEAVKRGQLTSEQGQKISAEQYEVAEMQFELLSARRVMVELDLARVPTPTTEATPASVQENEIVTVALPFSSFEINASVAEYLKLGSSQTEAIRQVMIIERHKIEPLMVQLRTAREDLRSADPEHTNEKEIKALADKQAGLLAKLIVANARMNAKVYKLLTAAQQRRLDELTRRSDLIMSR